MDLSELPPRPSRRHPWETSRARFFRRLIRASGLGRTARSVLDVGGGDAWFAGTLLDELEPSASITSWDPGYEQHPPEALAAAIAPRVRCTASRPAGQFDLVLLLDVLEHVEDDAGLLASLAGESLAPRGHLLLSVPAWPVLFGGHDRDLSHRRRYRPRDCRRLLEGAGFELLECGGLFHSLLVPRVMEKLAEAAGLMRGPPPNAGDWAGGAVQTRLLDSALTLDGLASAALAQLGLEVPGLSWWALCIRR